MQQQIRGGQIPSSRRGPGGGPASQNGGGGGIGGGQRSNSVSSAPGQGHPSQQTTNMPFQGPLVMTPVFQLGSNPRRNSRAMSRPDISDAKGMNFDPDQYNADGSLRTMHRLPGFDQSYAQAMNARYIRHSKQLDREKELSVKDIFSNKK